MSNLFQTLDEAFNYQNAFDAISDGTMLLELTSDADMFELLKLVQKLDNPNYLTDGHDFWLYLIFIQHEGNLWIPLNISTSRIDAQSLIVAGWRNRILTLGGEEEEEGEVRTDEAELCKVWSARVLDVEQVRAVLSEETLWEFWTFKWKLDSETAKVHDGDLVNEYLERKITVGGSS